MTSTTFAYALPSSQICWARQGRTLVTPKSKTARALYADSVSRASSAEDISAQSSFTRGDDASKEEAKPLTYSPTSDAVDGIEEYSQLKLQLLSRSKKGSGFLAVYLFLQQGLTAMLCSLAGSLAGYVYLKALMQSVDSYTAETDVPLLSAQEIQSQPLRFLAIGFAVYRQALTARLLIPFSLAAGVYLFNATQNRYFTLFQEFDMLLGFLFSYKAGQVTKIYDELKPKPRNLDEEKPARPTMANLPDIEEDRLERLLRDRRRK